MVVKKYSKIALTVLVCCFLGACTKDEGGSGGSSSGPNAREVESTPGTFFTTCGTVTDGTVSNPVSSDQLLGIEVLGPNVVGVTLESGPQLVYLQGLARPRDFLRDGAISQLESLAASGGYFFTSAFDDEGNPCTVNVGRDIVSGGAPAVVGTVISPSGNSYTEELIRSGYGEVGFSDGCGSNLITRCLEDLANNSTQIGGQVTQFLWKPVAERDGNLVVLLSPTAIVRVNGVELASSGGSNGFSATLRGNRPGGAYGANIRIEAFTPDGELLLFPGGAQSYTIPNGGSRVEFP